MDFRFLKSGFPGEWGGLILGFWFSKSPEGKLLGDGFDLTLLGDKNTFDRSMAKVVFLFRQKAPKGAFWRQKLLKSGCQSGVNAF